MHQLFVLLKLVFVVLQYAIFPIFKLLSLLAGKDLEALRRGQVLLTMRRHQYICFFLHQNVTLAGLRAERLMLQALFLEVGNVQEGGEGRFSHCCVCSNSLKTAATEFAFVHL